MTEREIKAGNRLHEAVTEVAAAWTAEQADRPSWQGARVVALLDARDDLLCPYRELPDMLRLAADCIAAMTPAPEAPGRYGLSTDPALWWETQRRREWLVAVLRALAPGVEGVVQVATHRRVVCSEGVALRQPMADLDALSGVRKEIVTQLRIGQATGVPLAQLIEDVERGRQ